MSDVEFDSFKDPGLRSAVRRVWGDERAPAELREKLLEMFPSQKRGARAIPFREPLILRFRSTLYGLAAAAVILFAVGLAFQDWVSGGRRAHIAPRVLALPAPVADDLVSNHEDLSKHPGPPGGTVEAADARFQFKSRLGFPVLAMDLPGTNWKFRGARVRSINGAKSGQLLFGDDSKRFVSVFSMPKSVVNGSAPACEYAQLEGTHPLAGFASNQAVYCLVASSKDGALSLDDLRSIRDTLRPLNGADVPMAVVMVP